MPDTLPTSALTQDLSLRFLLGQLWNQLSRRRRRQLASALVLMLLNSLTEVVSLAAVIPFLAVLTNPDNVWNYPFVKQCAYLLSIDSASGLLLPITVLFVFAAINAGAIRLLTVWINGRLAAVIGSDLSCEIYKRTLYQPYTVQVRRNSSILINSIVNDVNRVIGAILNQVLLVLSSGFIVIAVVIAVISVNPTVALASSLVIVLVYLFAVLVSKRPLQRLGQRQVALNQELIKSLQEGIGAIREVLLDGSQSYYIGKYVKADRVLRNAGAQAAFLSTYPRLVMEPVGIASIAFVGYYTVHQGGLSDGLPLLGVLALSAQRLIPVAQKVYEGWALMRSSKDSLKNVLDLLSQQLPVDAYRPISQPLSFNRTITLDSVRFAYASELPEVLKGLDLQILKGQCVGLIGTTGTGKSTLVDLLMGLLEPTKGRILVDGLDLYDRAHPERLAAWRAAIAHVPQTIYLADSSFAENIAFGIPKQSIDYDLVKKAAEQANIADFINNSPQGYGTFVGERGVKLSGGQRQRIGIARALYKQVQVLVLDEATASLDTATESAVMDSLSSLSSDITVIMIAHRLSTLARCDLIIELVDGSNLRLIDAKELL